MSRLWQLQFKTSLGPALWAALLAVPVCIILLYFLKLKRQPVVISSTLLWRKSMEDLRVNSLFQRLRRNILLILQLATVFLILLALTGPKWAGSQSNSKRLIIAIDNSASMSATDVSPNRLALARNKALSLIDQMASGDLAMVIAFSDKAEVVSSYSSNKNLLRQKINAISPTQRGSDLLEALQVADGLANPSRQVDGVVATQETTPKLYLLTDGGVDDIQGFSLGNLEPELIVIGQGPPEFKAGQNEAKSGYPTRNVAVLALQARRNEESANSIEVFGRIRNFDSKEASVELNLFRLGLTDAQAGKNLIDALKLTVAAETERGFQFTIADVGPQALMVQSLFQDDLEIDNFAFTAVVPDRKPAIRLITKGNRYLSNFFRSEGLVNRIRYSEIMPEDLKLPEIENEMKLGTYSLVIFDNCTSPDYQPLSNCIYFGEFPKDKRFKQINSFQSPTILDWDTTHPLMQYISDLSQIRIRDIKVPDPLPSGMKPLIETDRGPIITTGSRDGFTDVFVGFPLVDEKTFNTDWFLKFSFPLFLSNCLTHLTGLDGESSTSSHAPGSSFSIFASGHAGKTLLINPLNRTGEEASQSVIVDSSSRAAITSSGNQGVYSVTQDSDLLDIFSVDLFSQRESDLSTRGLSPVGAPQEISEKYQIKIGYTPVKGSGNALGVDSPLWKLAAMIALTVLAAEWFLYNRRVAV